MYRREWDLMEKLAITYSGSPVTAVFIVRGLPGSGKSHNAEVLRAISQIRGYTHQTCSADLYYITPDGKYVWSREEIGFAHGWCKANFRKALYHNTNIIIVDNTNVCADDMEFYYQAAKERGYVVEFIEPETSWRHDAEECANRNTHQVPLEAILRMQRRWESTETVAIKLKEKYERAKESISVPSVGN